MDLTHALRLLPPRALQDILPKSIGIVAGWNGIAFIGAGGKTTAMFQVARQLSMTEKLPVIVTTTTHLGAWQILLADQHIIADSSAPLSGMGRGFHGVILITGPVEGNRTTPLKDNVLFWLRENCELHDIPLLIEADGSRQKPLKAPAENEPAIPRFSEQVIQVAGLSGLGKPLTEEHVHRPETFARLSGLNSEAIITSEALTNVLIHPEGGLKNMLPNVRRVMLLNQADVPELQAQANKMARKLLSAYDAVLVASLKHEQIFAVHERIAGIILAAGESKRFGQPKQLLDWKGKPFVRQVAETALHAGLWPVTVVTGAYAAEIEAAIRDLNVRIVRNERWQEGQASSVRAGVANLTQPPPAIQNISEGVVGGAIFLLADQPQVTTSVLHALVEHHSQELYPIVAPLILMEQRANPVLFDCITFRDLLALGGDTGGRAVFSKHTVEFMPWHDDRLLLDVDTPEQYKRLISDNTL